MNYLYILVILQGEFKSSTIQDGSSIVNFRFAVRAVGKEGHGIWILAARLSRGLGVILPGEDEANPWTGAESLESPRNAV